MSSEPVHARILTQAARQVLCPLGVRQRGRSRLWVDDHGWWLILVEFQPSSWAKGAYLNVGAMWLWQRTDAYTFSYGHRVSDHHEFREEASFAMAAAELAKQAGAEVVRYRQLFSNILAVADALDSRASADIWSRYHAAVASALASRRSRAELHFAALISEAGELPWQQSLRETARELRAHLNSAEAFCAHAANLVRNTRAALKLSEAENPLPLTLSASAAT